MTVEARQNPFAHFTDTNGDPLAGGYVYFGLANQDPRQYPAVVYYDKALTLPVVQPLRTTAGYLSRNGSPTNVYMNGDCSVLVLDSAQRQVSYAAQWQGVADAAAAGAAATAAPYAGAAAASATAAATSASVAAAAQRIYASGAAGDAATTAGQYYYVVSSSTALVYELWLHNGTGGTDTGKRFPSSRFVMDAGWGLASTRREGWYLPGITDGVLVLGDSFTRGAGATNPETGGWPVLLQTALQTLLGNGGSGFYGVPGSAVTLSENFNKMSFTGSWATLGQAGPNNNSRYAYSNGATASLTLTGDTLRVLYTEFNNSGQFTVTVDGGAPVTCGRVISPGTFVPKYVDIPLGSTGSHSIVITNGAGYFYLTGCAAINAAGGPVVYRMGGDGFIAESWAQQKNQSTLILTPENLNFIDQLQPRLTVLELGINDWNFQTPLVEYAASVEAIIKRALPYGQVLLVNSVNFSSTVRAITQDQYNAQLRALAAKYDCGYLDMNARWGPFKTGVVRGLQTALADGHPTDAGHQDFANAVYYAITGIPELVTVQDPVALAAAYQTRVVADGGVVTSLPSVVAAFELAITYGITATARYSADWGVKKDVSNNITKLYALEGTAWDLGVGAGSPLWVSAAQNTFPAVRFSGVAQTLVSAAFTLNNPTVACAAIKPITHGASKYLWDGLATNSGGLAQVGTSPTVQQSSGGLGAASGNLALGSWGYVRSRMDGANSELQIGGTMIGTGTTFGNPGGITLGGAGGGTNCANFDFGEGWWLPIPLTLAQKTALAGYMKTKWATS